MKKIRLLVGTKKGGFILTSDAKRKTWKVSGPLFSGWEVYHMAGSPADPDRIYASQTSGWFGQVIQRSSDGGKTWETPGGGAPKTGAGMPQGESNKFLYEGKVGQHLYYDNTPRPWEFKRVWHLEPSLTDPDTCYAGVEDAALFKTTDGARTWKELPALRTHATAPQWAPGAGGLCLHTILLDKQNPERLFVAISAAGVFRSDDAGGSWKPMNRGLRSDYMPKDAEVGYCVHRLAQHPAKPDVLYMQLHGGVLRSDDAGGRWKEIGKGLPNDFGFPIVVNANEPETIYVIPIDLNKGRIPPDGKLRVYRSKNGGGSWKALTKGLPQEHCYVNVLRDAMAVDTLDPCGVYFGTSGGQVYASADGGDSWKAIVRDLPYVLSVSAQTLK